MSRNLIFSEGEYYHCYGRGNEKRKIYLNKKDYERFLQLLFVSNNKRTIHLSDFVKKSFEDIFLMEREDTLVDIGAYCLMPNHFHLLLKEKEKGGISLFMQKVMTAYTMYFNKKNDRKGSLFESTFKAQHITDDRHLKYIFSYIHLNPVKIIDPKWKENGVKDSKKVQDFLTDFQYSSYLDFLKKHRAQKLILNKSSFPDYFDNTSELIKEIFEWLHFNDREENNNVKV